jgi:membrane associated rhomboid family serine protease
MYEHAHRGVGGNTQGQRLAATQCRFFGTSAAVGSAGQGGGGVAYAAHIGGFIFGILMIKFFDRGQQYVEDNLAKQRK